MATEEGKIKKALSDWSLLEEFQVNLSDGDSEVYWAVFGWPKKIQEVIHKTNEDLDAAAVQFEENLIGDVGIFAEQVHSLQMTVAGFSKQTDISKYKSISVEARKVASRLKEAQANAQTYNNRERLFGLPVTDYEHLQKCVRDFEPYKNLWITADEWQTAYRGYMNDSFMDLDPEKLDQDIQSAAKAIQKALRAFKELPECAQAADVVRGWIAEFQP